MNRSLGLIVASLLSAAGLAGPAASAQAAPVGSVSVLAHVPSPGFPADPRVVGNVIYEGTYTNPGGDKLASKVFAFDAATGALQRTYTITGQNLSQPHGIQVAATTARGQLVLLDRTSGRILLLDTKTGAQSLYATVPWLSRCVSYDGPWPCKPTLGNLAPMPDYAVWGPDGSLYVTDYQQGVIWRVPPGGGTPQEWFASRVLDGETYGTAGLLMAPDHHTLLVDQASNLGLGGGGLDPAGGELFSLPIEPDGQPGKLHAIWQSPPTALPDGFALSQSGDIYMPEVGLTEQVVELSPSGRVLNTFGQLGTGANGSAIPFDSPSGLAWLGTQLVIANQSALFGTTAHQALLELETGQQGAPTYVPAGAGLAPAVKHTKKKKKQKPAAPVLGHEGRWITDAAGRVVVLHGTNLVAKTTTNGFAPAGMGFDAADAAFLQGDGFNAVRLGVIYQALEPHPGVFDTNYLNSIAATQRLLAARGIYSLIDMHDDNWGPSYGGEGFPAWATPSGGSNTAWDDFWANTDGPGGIGLQDYYALALQKVAAKFAAAPDVLGYDVINEPQPGTLNLLCADPLGCPLDQALTTFYERVIPVVRQVDPTHLIWVEPNLDFGGGGGESLPSLGDPEVGFSFHNYCLLTSATGGTQDNAAFCPVAEKLIFQHAEQESKASGDALLMTEFGSTPLAGQIARVANEADAQMVGWTEWTLTTNGTTDFASTPSLIDDEHLPPTGANINQAQQKALVRAYPQRISGTPRAWSYDPSSHVFTLSYSTKRVSGGGFAAGSLTTVELPSLDYPSGYSVSLGGATVASKPGAGRLVLSDTAPTVSVTVKPRS